MKDCLMRLFTVLSIALALLTCQGQMVVTLQSATIDTAGVPPVSSQIRRTVQLDARAVKQLQTVDLQPQLPMANTLPSASTRLETHLSSLAILLLLLSSLGLLIAIRRHEHQRRL
jgi:hypothetical protein